MQLDFIVFFSGEQGSNPARAVNFHTANLNINCALCSNRLCLCPLDVLSLLYCQQAVSCALVT